MVIRTSTGRRKRRAVDHKPVFFTPFFCYELLRLPAVAVPAMPRKNLTGLDWSNHALRIHGYQHSATLHSRTVELGLVLAITRFAQAAGDST
jgi:hypothetical protein